MVAMNSVSPRTATPRFTRPQQGREAWSGVWEYVQKMRPVAASRATTSFGAWTVYITPSTTSGVASNFSSDRAWKIHWTSRFFTFSGVTCDSVLYRWLL